MPSCHIMILLLTPGVDRKSHTWETEICKTYVVSLWVEAVPSCCSQSVW